MSQVYTHSQESHRKYQKQVESLSLVMMLKPQDEEIWLGLGALRIFKGEKYVLIDSNGWSYDSGDKVDTLTIELDPCLTQSLELSADEELTLDLVDIFEGDVRAELWCDEGNLKEGQILSFTLNKGEHHIEVVLN